MKKLLKLPARILPLLVVSMILTLSCVFDAAQPEAGQPEETALPLRERLSIDDARVFFAESFGSVNICNPGTRSDEEPPFPEPDILWEDAVYSMFFGYEVIESPIGNIFGATYSQGDPAISGISEGDIIPANTVFHIISGIDSAGSVRFRVVHLIPGESFLGESGINLRNFRLWDTADNYTGSILLYELTGEFVTGFEVSGGYLTHFLVPAGSVDVEGEENNTVMYVGGLPGGTGGDNDGGEVDGTVEVVAINVTARRDWKFDWDDYGWPDIDPWDGGTSGTGGGGGGGNNNDNDKDNCSVCQQKPCKCCSECQKYPCECCTVCKKKVCQCEDPEDPCESLRKKLNDPLFMGLLDALQSKARSGNKEFGYKFKLGPNGEYIFSNEIEGSDTDQMIRFDFQSGEKWDGCIHSHFPGCGNIFSFGDLFFIFNSYNKGVVAGNMGSFSYGLTTPDGIYFLVAEDRWLYQQWVMGFYTSSYQMDMDEIRRFEEEYLDFYGIDVNTPSEEAEKNFLKYITENFMGLGLMKYNPGMNKFEKKKYSLYGGEFYTEDCPE